MEASHLFCFECDGYVLNDNRTGDIAQLKEYLALAKSPGGGRRAARSCRSHTEKNEDLNPKRPVPVEDPFTTSIWHRRVSLMLKMFRLWRKRLHLKLESGESTISSGKELQTHDQLAEARQMAEKPATLPSIKRVKQSKRGRPLKSSRAKRKRTSLSTEEISSPSSKKSRSSSPSLSMELRCTKGMTGLVNLGNTCYMNVVIQVLGHIDQFCDSICCMSLENPTYPRSMNVSHSGRLIKTGLHGGSATIETVENLEQKDSTTCQELHAVFNIIWSGLCPLYSPKGMRHAVSKNMPMFNDIDQHDAHEFLTMLLNSVHEEMKNIYGIKPSAVEECFEGTLACQIMCPGSECSSDFRYENFQELDVSFPEEVISMGRTVLMSTAPSYSLVEMIGHFTSWEQFPCNCNAAGSQKRSLIRRCPRILRIHINRFCWIPSSGSGPGCCKINWFVQFPSVLEFDKFCMQQEGVKLRLCAVIVHDGMHFDRGHYHCYFFHKPEGVWIRASDKDLTKVQEDEVLSAQAYILFYQKIEESREYRPSDNEQIV